MCIHNIIAVITIILCIGVVAFVASQLFKDIESTPVNKPSAFAKDAEKNYKPASIEEIEKRLLKLETPTIYKNGEKVWICLDEYDHNTGKRKKEIIQGVIAETKQEFYASRHYCDETERLHYSVRYNVIVGDKIHWVDSTDVYKTKPNK